MQFELTRSGPKLTRKAISIFEKKHSFSLPTDYKEFLLRCNGGTLADDVCFSFKENRRNSGTVLKRLYPLQKTGSKLDNLDDRYEMFVSAGRMPSNLLPIAGDAFGNQICLSLSGSDVGAVYFWNHEKEGDTKRKGASTRNLQPVARSFSDFLGLLRPLEEDDD